MDEPDFDLEDSPSASQLRAKGRREIDLVPNDLERVFGKPPVTKPTTRKRDPVHALLGTTGASSERGN